MPILIDGDNLLGTSGRERSTAERQALALEIAGLARRERQRALTVFDGMDPGLPALGDDVRFAGRGRTADDVILETLREQSDRRDWLVVTSDKSLGDRCRGLEARSVRCDQFRHRLREP